MLVKLYSSSVFGITATTITVEVNIDNGLNFYLVGLPDNAVKESQQRIRAFVALLLNATRCFNPSPYAAAILLRHRSR